MPRKFPDRDDDRLPVMVPRSDKRLVPLTPDRVGRLRQHLREALLDLGKARRLDRFAAPVSPEPDGFPAIVARAACSLCKGWCCRKRFLTTGRLPVSGWRTPKITEQAIELIYLARVPDATYQELVHLPWRCRVDQVRWSEASWSKRLFGEWDKTTTNAVPLSGSGVIRKPGSTVAFQNTEMKLAVTITDGKVTGATSSGRGNDGVATGGATSPAGKLCTWSTKSTGKLQFVLDVEFE